MKILLRNAFIKDPESEFFGSKKDILIAGDIISEIADRIDENSDREIDLTGKWVTPAFFDMSAHFNDPGKEHKEDINSGIAAAMAGGFSQVCLLPNTDPVTDHKGQVEYIISRSMRQTGEVIPLGSVTVGAKGDQMAEIMDLYNAGAIAFTDGVHPIVNSEVLFKALQYVQKFDGMIINRPCDPYLAAYGQMHEGVRSTELGMKGIPSLAEELMLQRDLSILEYAGGRIHFSCISSKEGVELIKEAKEKGLQVTCDVAIHNLLWTDEQTVDFDTNFKVQPPLRSSEDRKALIEGVNSGAIDVIVSDHQPQDEESKKLEFDQAKFGMISLQTLFSGLLSIKEELSFDQAVSALTHHPRKLLKQNDFTIAKGQKASLGLFDPEEEWVFDGSANRSKSGNSPFFGQKLTGRSVGLIHKGRLFQSE